MGCVCTGLGGYVYWVGCPTCLDCLPESYVLGCSKDNMHDGMDGLAFCPRQRSFARRPERAVVLYAGLGAAEVASTAA